MCFFKPKLPAIQMPNVAQNIPAITETKAPEPNAPVFGGGAQALVESGETGKKGISGLKIPSLERAAGLQSLTGVSRSGFNVTR